MYVVHAALEVTPPLPLQCGPGPGPRLSVVPLSDRQGGDGTPPLYVLDLQIGRVRSVCVITIACSGNNPIIHNQLLKHSNNQINSQSTPQALNCRENNPINSQSTQTLKFKFLHFQKTLHRIQQLQVEYTLEHTTTNKLHHLLHQGKALDLTNNSPRYTIT